MDTPLFPSLYSEQCLAHRWSSINMYRMKESTSCPTHSEQKSRVPLNPNLSRFDQGWGLGKGMQWWWRGKSGFQSCWSSPCPTSGSYYDDPSMAQGSFSIFSKTTIKNHQQQAFVGITDFSEDFPEKVADRRIEGRRRSKRDRVSEMESS